MLVHLSGVGPQPTPFACTEGRQVRDEEEVTVEVSVVERVRTIVEPLLAERNVGLYDLELHGGAVRILVETGDLEVIEGLTKAISRALDEADPIESHYTLEVSSPGLERPLRTPAHYAGAVGTAVTVKTMPGTEGERRVRGVLVAADDTSFTVRDDTGGERTLRYGEVERARTVFEWAAAPKPGTAAAPNRPKPPTTRKQKAPR
jgi:ribosome maturation factor RimP